MLIAVPPDSIASVPDLDLVPDLLPNELRLCIGDRLRKATHSHYMELSSASGLVGRKLRARAEMPCHRTVLLEEDA